MCTRLFKQRKERSNSPEQCRDGKIPIFAVRDLIVHLEYLQIISRFC